MKITSVKISVPYKSSGNSILQKPVIFEIYKNEDIITAEPLLDESERRIANLPPELNFKYKGGKITSTRSPNDGNLHVLQSIAEELKKLNLL